MRVPLIGANIFRDMICVRATRGPCRENRCVRRSAGISAQTRCKSCCFRYQIRTILYICAYVNEDIWIITLYDNSIARDKNTRTKMQTKYRTVRISKDVAKEFVGYTIVYTLNAEKKFQYKKSSKLLIFLTLVYC